MRTAGAAGGEQEVLQRRVGEHDAELGQIEGDGARESTAAELAPQQNDGAHAAGEQARFGIVDGTQLAGVIEGRHHDGERFVAAVLAAPQLGHGVLVAGVACQMKAAQALDGDDSAACKQRGAALYDGVARFARGARDGGSIACAPPGDMWPAGKAGIGLGMEAPVERVGVFGGAFRAHGKRIHGGLRAVVG